MNTSFENLDITDKIIKGVQLAYEKLVRDTAKENGELIFSDNGKIIHVKAKKLLKQLEQN